MAQKIVRFLSGARSKPSSRNTGEPMDKELLYRQYLFLRSPDNPEGRLSFSRALFVLSMKFGKHESAIAKALEEYEEGK